MAYMPYYSNQRRSNDKFYCYTISRVNGDIPIKDFLNSLDVKMRAQIYGMIELLQEKGNQLREPYSKHLDDGIFELRCKVGSNITRVLYFFLL